MEDQDRFIFELRVPGYVDLEHVVSSSMLTIGQEESSTIRVPQGTGWGKPVMLRLSSTGVNIVTVDPNGRTSRWESLNQWLQVASGRIRITIPEGGSNDVMEHFAPITPPDHKQRWDKPYLHIQNGDDVQVVPVFRKLSDRVSSAISRRGKLGIFRRNKNTAFLGKRPGIGGIVVDDESIPDRLLSFSESNGQCTIKKLTRYPDVTHQDQPISSTPVLLAHRDELQIGTLRISFLHYESVYQRPWPPQLGRVPAGTRDGKASGNTSLARLPSWSYPIMCVVVILALIEFAGCFVQ